tara:strand:+ start:1406 stop:1588 length:183 start_codon:yes stop_codon:yes gene_type:complete
MEDEQVQDIVDYIQERISETDLLCQVSIACEWKEWFLHKGGSEVLYVSEVIDNKGLIIEE